MTEHVLQRACTTTLHSRPCLSPPNPSRLLQGPAMRTPIQNFIKTECLVFDADVEHKLAYTEVRRLPAFAPRTHPCLGRRIAP